MCMAKNTTTPSTASPRRSAPRFANAIRYAALDRQLRIAGHAVADAAHRLDQVGLAAFVELRAQAADVGFDDVGLRIEVVVPHPLEEHGPGHHSPFVAHQFFEQAIFAWLEDDRHAV